MVPVGATVSSVTVVATLLGGVLAIGSAGTFNHVYERDRDRRMNRTSDRPLVHDLVAGAGELDTAMDQFMHHTGLTPDEVSLRRLFSYVDNLEDLLRTDANIYGWPRES